MKAFTWISITILLAITTRFLLIGVYKVPSNSMAPSLIAGDYILVSKMSYGLKFPWSTSQGWSASQPKHGDVVVLNFKKRQTTPYVKRVIAGPGDKVEITSGRLTVNGKLCEYKNIDATKEDIFLEDCGGVTYPVELPVSVQNDEKISVKTVPEGHVFALSDSRENIEDSRTLDFVHIDQIAGKVKFILYSYGSTQDSILENKTIRWNRILTTP